ncbi:MAG: tyrosine-type recombinase/integrase [Candidatus Bathyarchaeia archaeon]
MEDKDVRAMVQAADNLRDRAMLHVLFEGALRPGELLSMRVGSVEFRNKYCMITANGKTGIKRIPLIARLAILITVLFLAARILRVWCRYLCPQGALLALVSRFSLLGLKRDIV